MALLGRLAAALAVVFTSVLTDGCTTSVPGRAVRASHGVSTSTGGNAPIRARDLLLQDVDSTPLGPASAARVGDNYFTIFRPPECSAALLFKGSPLRPPASSDFAESAYNISGRAALYAESVDVYSSALDTHDVVWHGFREVSECHGDVVPVSPAGEFPPMKLSYFATPSDGVLVWTMTRADWTFDYGLAVVPQAALLISACDSKPGFPMAEWAAKRQAQIDSRA